MLAAKKRKRCKSCGDLFSPSYNDSMQVVCSPVCAIRFNDTDKGKKHVEKQRKAANRAAKRQLRSKDKAWWRTKAQKAFNAYIRARDKGQPCISCGKSEAEIEGDQGWKPGGVWDCGHYLTVGAHPELRYEEVNAWRQCKSCNGGSGKYSQKDKTVHEHYRGNLIEKVGIDAVEWLEGPHDQKKYTIEELQEIESTYKQKLKELQNA